MNKTKKSKVYTYLWQGINKSGIKMSGDMISSDSTLVKIELRHQGIPPTRINKRSFFSAYQRPISNQDISIFIRQLATLIKAGVPLVQAIDLIHHGSNHKSMQKMLYTIRADLESGNALAKSLAKHPNYFDALFCNLVKTGELSGTLDIMLERIAQHKEKFATIIGKVKKAMFYPATVITVAVIVATLMLLFVVPEFESVFQNIGADLPLLTRMVIKLSKWVQQYWWFCLFIIITSIVAFQFSQKRYAAFALFVDQTLLKLPILGTILQKSIIARFARTLATTFAAGMPLVDALNAVSGSCGNLLYNKAIQKIRALVATGLPLQTAMRTTNLFPNMVIQMVAVGEESGSLDNMLSKVADFYEEQVDHAVDGLSTLLEPVIMVILGVLVGGLVIAMYLPIFKLGTAI